MVATIDRTRTNRFAMILLRPAALVVFTAALVVFILVVVTSLLRLRYSNVSLWFRWIYFLRFYEVLCRQVAREDKTAALLHCGALFLTDSSFLQVLRVYRCAVLRSGTPFLQVLRSYRYYNTLRSKIQPYVLKS